MDAEVTAEISAGLHDRMPQRLTQCNGYRPRRCDTRVGTLDLRIPKLRTGSLWGSKTHAYLDVDTLSRPGQP
jgi:putative transposase